MPTAKMEGNPDHAMLLLGFNEDFLDSSPLSPHHLLPLNGISSYTCLPPVGVEHLTDWLSAAGSVEPPGPDLYWVLVLSTWTPRH